MPKLLIAFASATLLLASSGIWKANAATIANAGTLAPLMKSYAPAEKVAPAWPRTWIMSARSIQSLFFDADGDPTHHPSCEECWWLPRSCL